MILFELKMYASYTLVTLKLAVQVGKTSYISLHIV